MKKQIPILISLFFTLLSCGKIWDAVLKSDYETELLSQIYADGKLLNEYVYDQVSTIF